MAKRKLFRKWARWLLPLLVARAFLPVGFMLATQADGLQLAFCSGHLAGHGGHHNAHFDPPCPFAQAAVAANIDVPHLDTAAMPGTEQFVPDRSVAAPLVGPQRIDRIRGPPSLS